MLSVVIVNTFRPDLLHQLLESFYTYNPDFPHEIIIASNGSEEKDKQELLQEFPALRWIDTGYNAGFGRANNVGLRIAKGDVLLLLNPDTIAVDDSIKRCYERFKESSHAACGIQLLNPDGTDQISGSYFVKGGLNHLLPIPYYGSFIRWLGYTLKTKVPSVEHVKDVQEVDWISGAFLMTRQSVVEKVGLLDEDFFLYAEEVEWCSRLKKAGTLVLYGDLKIIHLEGATTDKIAKVQERGYHNLYDKKGLQLIVSNHLRVRKQYGVGWFLFLLLNYTFGLLVFWIASTLHHLFTLSNPFKQWKRVGAFANNILKLWALSPTIIRNKPHFYKMF